MIEESATQQRVITPKEKKSDKRAENSLRPKSLKEYIGQTEIKQNLNVFIKAAQKRKEPLEHTLLYGPPGLGKTTLAYIIAKETGVNIKVTSGPAIEKPGDLASIVTNLKENDLLFIDEIHRLRPVVEEILYSAMEDFVLDIIIGKGPSARSMRLSLPPFTLIGATTKASMLSSPLRDRFGNIFRLNFYNNQEIKEIIMRASKILKTDIQEEAAIKLASCARKTPRIANRLLRRTRDFAEVEDLKEINLEIAKKSLKYLGVDNKGLDKIDREVLETIIHKFKGGPVGLSTLAASISEDQSTIEDMYEPYLMQLGFLERTHRGRKVTDLGFEHLGLKNISDEAQSKLKF